MTFITDNNVEFNDLSDWSEALITIAEQISSKIMLKVLGTSLFPVEACKGK